MKREKQSGFYFLIPRGNSHLPEALYVEPGAMTHSFSPSGQTRGRLVSEIELCRQDSTRIVRQRRRVDSPDDTRQDQLQGRDSPREKLAEYIPWLAKVIYFH